METAGKVRRVALLTASEDVLAAVLALNEAAEEETAPLDPARLAALLRTAAFAEALVDAGGEVLAFLIGFDHAADYDSPNFLWFRDRMDRFAYVDRVVVAEAARGRGLARALYAAYADHARAHALERLVCEVNRVPPNPRSDAFHAALGFAEVGRGAPVQGKLVRYLARPVAEGVAAPAAGA